MAQKGQATFDPATRKAGIRRTVTILLVVIVVLLGLFLLQFVI